MRALYYVSLITLILSTACKPNISDNGSNGVCTQQSDCSTDALPACVEGECVACETADQCGCHEACVENECVPMGAQSTNQTLNAHGNWDGTPGTDSYDFDSLCESDADCGIGQRCNPMTAGCVQASLFTTSCSTDAECDAGPNGEVLACELTTQLCLPTARCQTTTNCCGAEGFVCDTAAQICKSPRTECTPPDPITNECPFEPRLQDSCDPGYFCSPVGECVQCLCNDDCVQGQQCYPATQTCKAADYCESDGECSDPAQVCDEERTTCAAFCDESTASSVCSSEEYCDLQENVCRPLSELPCTDDRYAPNQSAEQAALLTLPELGETRVETELSLCEEQEDWFTLPLSAGDELTITMTSASGITSSYAVLAADGLTQLATGTLGPLGSELLRFTANRSDNYLLRVSRSGAQTGYYALSLSLAQGDSCSDPAEATQGNDSGTTATLIFAPNTSIDDDCSRETLAGNELVSCNSSALTLCDGDVDYYHVELNGGSKLSATLGSFGGDLDIDLYGPFENIESFDATALIDSATNTAPQKEVSATARVDSSYVVRVYRDFGEETGYSLSLEIDPPPSVCLEDDYEGNTLNETSATAAVVELSAGSTTELDLNVCIGDIEWFQLGTLGSNPIPANHRVSLSLSNTSGVSLAAGLTPESLIEATEGSLLITQTEAAPYWVRLIPDESNPNHLPLTLSATLTAPPACSADPSIAPGSAVTLNSESFVAAGDVLVSEEQSSCPDDDDWYLITVPSGLDLSVMATYDPTEVDLAISLYDSTVADMSEDTHSAPPTQGLLSTQATAGSSFQIVREDAGEARDIYIRVSNQSGWTLDNYGLQARLVEPSCIDDVYETNDGIETATTLSLARKSFGTQLDQSILWDLASCGGNDDWFSLRLLPGDALSSQLDFDPTQSNLSLTLYEEGTDAPVATSNGTSLLTHVLDEEQSAGRYLFLVSPQSGQAPDYALNVEVERACEDDILEPVPPATTTQLSVPGDQSELVLCSDEDIYELTSSVGNLTACVLFEHDLGDIDIELYSAGGENLLDASLTKNDVESVSIEVLESTTFQLRVFLDSRDSGAVSYRLVTGDGIDCESL